MNDEVALSEDEILQYYDDMGRMIDHLVDALGDASSPMRRALILADIDQYPETTQTEISTRLNIAKSAVSRHVDWLADHGCIQKTYGFHDAREIRLIIHPYSRKHLHYALALVNFSYEHLKNILRTFILAFDNHKPSLREGKIMVTLSGSGDLSKKELMQSLYNGPAASDNRALDNLHDEGMIDKNA